METFIRVQNWTLGINDVKENNQFYWLAKLKKNLVKVGLNDIIHEAERDFFDSQSSPVMTYVQLSGKYGVYTIGSEKFFPLSSCLKWSLLVFNETLFEYYWSKTSEYKDTKLRIAMLNKKEIIKMNGSNPFLAYLFFRYLRWFDKNEFFQCTDKSFFIIKHLLTVEAFYYECYNDIKMFLSYAVFHKFEEVVYFDNLRLIERKIKKDIAKELLSARKYKLLLTGVFNNLYLNMPKQLLTESPMVIDELSHKGVVK